MVDKDEIDQCFLSKNSVKSFLVQI
jgi:hypothetical protein